MDLSQLGKNEKAIILSVLRKVKTHGKRTKILAGLDLKTLKTLPTKEEWKLIRAIIRINPKQYGFKGPRYGIARVPKNLMVIRNQQYRTGRNIKKIPPQLVPKNTYTAYQNLVHAMEKDISKTVLIESAYRSPAYQLIVFLHYLHYYRWDAKKTCSRVALPGYSEHGFPPRQALDFITVDGIPSDTNLLAFAKTEEYLWLCKHAYKFHFYLSYPKKNKWGIMFEPWHWSFRK